MVIGAGIAVVALVAAVSAVALTRTSDDDNRWSQFPRTLSCVPDQDLDVPGDSANPAATTVQRVRLSHPGAQTLAVDIDFVESVPPNPTLVTSPYSGEDVFAPGTLDYKIVIETGLGAILTLHTNDGWGATRSDLELKRVLDEEVPDYPSERILTSYDATARTVHLEYDLEGQPQFFNGDTFTPNVRVNADRVTAITPDSPDGARAYYTSQLCAWNSMVRAPAPRTTPPAQPSRSATPPTSPPAVGATESCGVSEAQALAAGLEQLPTESITGRPWAREAVASNFDPCADLSSILVTIEGGTGSSPVQAMMFHRGEYLGTGTAQAYGFTDLDSNSSTRDTVVLTYKTGQTCNACNDGVITPVRFLWDGQQVQMLDALPEQ